MIHRTVPTNPALGKESLSASHSGIRHAEPVERGSRLAFIDGLRALACLSVVIGHTTYYMALWNCWPDAVTWLGGYGHLGVQVFFVLSGFVISHTLSRSAVTPAFMGNFLLRRSVRLDPVYWVMMALGIAIYASSAILEDDRLNHLPSWKVIALNVCYLQTMTGCGSVLLVSWTLCIEVQFYIVYIVVLGLTEAASPLVAERRDRRTLIYLGLMAPLVLLSLATAAGIRVPGKDFVDWRWMALALLVVAACAALAGRWWIAHGLIYIGILCLGIIIQSTHQWFLPFWYMFVAGDLVARVVRREMPVLPVLAFLILIPGLLRLAPGLDNIVGEHSGPLAACVAALTAAAILLCGLCNKMSSWLNLRVLQYLGLISYSLYLTHFEVGSRVLNLAVRFAPDNVLVHWLCYFLALAASIVSAHLLYHWVERPAQLLSKRLKQAARKPRENPCS